jgi:quinoprotein glucose dehydrogenase
LSDQYKGRFFLADFRGGASSGIHSFDVRPKGASFELGAYEQFIWECLPTDVDFGVEGGIYFSDWVETWNKTGKGRIYRAFDANADKNQIAHTKALLNTTLTNLPLEDLRALLSHPDQRVRLEVQFAFVSMGESGMSRLAPIALSNTNQMTALHAIWGLGQGLRKGSTNAQLTLLLAARNKDPELRAQAVKMLGEATIPQAGPILQPLLADPEPRVRFFAAISLGRLKHRPSMNGLFTMLEQNADADPYLRHAAVIGLAGIADREALRNAISHSSASVRLGAALALRRLEDPSIADFLNDTSIQVVAEAARAINDLPIEPALPQLAALITKTFTDTQTKTNTSRPSGVEAAISIVAVETGITTIPEQILLRAINANFRLGHQTNAEALAQFAANSSNADNLRADALHALADWAKPSGRDRVTGLWRPVPPRDAEHARTALNSRLRVMLASKSPAMQIASIQVAQKLGITQALESLLTIARGSRDSSVRLQALKALAILDRSQLQDVLEPALNSNDSALQAEATRLQAEINPAAALKRVKEQLESDSIASKRSAVQALAILPQAEADKLLSGLVDRLSQNQLAPELQLDVLDAAGKRTSREVLDRVQRFEAKRPKDDPLAAFTECLQGGNAAEGQKLFYERAEVFCSRCHQVNSEGGEAGPNLTGLGARQSRSYILESIVMPNNKFAEGWENVTISLKDGRSFAGKVVKETSDTIVVNNTEDGDVPLKKSEIATRNRALSGMPEEFRQILTKQELRDLVEFLATQK